MSQSQSPNLIRLVNLLYLSYLVLSQKTRYFSKNEMSGWLVPLVCFVVIFYFLGFFGVFWIGLGWVELIWIWMDISRWFGTRGGDILGRGGGI